MCLPLERQYPDETCCDWFAYPVNYNGISVYIAVKNLYLKTSKQQLSDYVRSPNNRVVSGEAGILLEA